MCEKKLKKAKEMFFSYSCSHFFMARNEVYDIYKEFNVTEKQELEWVQEYKDDLCTQMAQASDPDIKSLFFQYERVVLNTKDWGGLRKMSDLAFSRIDSDDSFTKLLLAERILNVVEKFKSFDCIEEQLIDSVINVACKLLASVKNKPIVVKEFHKQRVLEETLEEGNILKRVDESVELCTSLSSEVC